MDWIKTSWVEVVYDVGEALVRIFEAKSDPGAMRRANFIICVKIKA